MFFIGDYDVAAVLPTGLDVNRGYCIVLFDAVLSRHYVLLALRHALESSCDAYDVLVHFRELCERYLAQFNVD